MDSTLISRVREGGEDSMGRRQETSELNGVNEVVANAGNCRKMLENRPINRSCIVNN